MRKDLAERHDLIALRDAPEDLRGEFASLAQDIAGDFQLAFDGGLTHGVLQVSRQGAVLQELRDFVQRG